MKREFYKLKFVCPIHHLCIGTLVDVENRVFLKKKRDRTWGRLLFLNYADFFIVNPTLGENTSGIDSLDHLLRP